MSHTLTIFAVWLTFPNIQAAYTLKGRLYVLLAKGYKSALYVYMGKILQSPYKTLFENIALFSLPLNGIFLFLQLEVISLDLDPENSFVKKRTSFSLTDRNNIVAFNKKKYQRPGRVALGAVFIKKTRSNNPTNSNGNSNLLNLSRYSKTALIITPLLLARCEKSVFSRIPEKI